ncbi:MAG: DUF4124 domain-containing protein [Hydrogenophaga sp.]|nr:DUF4124 domain-containing protein [Hydrogenophaga sp.]
MDKLCRRMVLLCSVMALVAPLQAADIYRWVDDQGRTHLSDVVPDRYRDSATRIDSRRYELTPEQRREADERAAQEGLRDAPANPAVSAPAAPTSTVATPAPPVKRPVERVTEATSCETWWRLYRESQECFGPFRTVGGGIKPEAFDHCNEIPSPETRCGPYRD